MTDKKILVGEFGRAQGIRGEVRIKSYTEDPLALTRYTPLTSENGTQTYKILAARVHDRDILVVRVDGMTTREQAEHLTRRKIFAPRTALAPGTDDEYLQADLIGLKAELQDGTPVGEVIAIENYGAGDLLDIRKPDDKQTYLLPFTHACVPVVDIRNGRIIIDPPQGWDTEE